MASERQISANRRNATKSTGPRSTAGKQRASRNAYKHGLARSICDSETSKDVETLARKLANHCDHELVIQYAREAAVAVSDIARVQRAKVGLIDRAEILGALDAPKHSLAELKQLAKEIFTGRLDYFPEAATPPMPENSAARAAEAIRRAAPELMKFERYEQNARARRDRAIKKILELQHTLACLPSTRAT